METTDAFAFTGQLLKNVPPITAPNVGASRFSCGVLVNVGTRGIHTDLMRFTAAVFRSSGAVLTKMRFTVPIAATSGVHAHTVLTYLLGLTAAVFGTSAAVLAKMRCAVSIATASGVHAHIVLTYLMGLTAAVFGTGAAVLTKMRCANSVSTTRIRSTDQEHEKYRHQENCQLFADDHDFLPNRS